MGIIPSPHWIKLDATHSKHPGGFHIILRVVTDVDTITWRYAERSQCLQEDRWFRLRHAKLSRTDNHAEVLADLVMVKKRI